MPVILAGLLAEICRLDLSTATKSATVIRHGSAVLFIYSNFFDDSRNLKARIQGQLSSTYPEEVIQKFKHIYICDFSASLSITIVVGL